MKISTEIGSIANHVGMERAVEYTAKAGFDGWDLSLFEMAPYDPASRCVKSSNHPLCGNGRIKLVRELKQIGLDNGIVCNQSHAPFPVREPTIRSLLKSAIECSAEAGADICVVHPDNLASPEANAELYWELLPFAKEHGIKLATENMFNWDHARKCASPAACSDAASFSAHLDAVNDSDLVACLDLGHAEMQGLNTSAVELIHALGCRLQALHIHDNDRRYDCHRSPFTMDIDFAPILKALKEIGYNGWFTLEANRHLSDYKQEDIFKGVLEMAAVTRRLADMFDAL